jgi:hypothetical protein
MAGAGIITGRPALTQLLLFLAEENRTEAPGAQLRQEQTS